MPIQNIAGVIIRLNDIVKECIATENRAGYFAALYKRMTMAVSEGILKNGFEDGTRMERLDIIFAQRYLDAWDAYHGKATCSSSWLCAFDNCEDKSMTVIQHLLTGINAHINLDLAIAAAKVAPGNSIHLLENDFNHINDVIASLLDDIQECLRQLWFPMRFLQSITNRREEAVLNFSMGMARKTSFANAVILANMNNEFQEQHLKQMDIAVKHIGDKIKSPGMWSKFLLKIIRLTEYEDIARTIRLIDTTVID